MAEQVTFNSLSQQLKNRDLQGCVYVIHGEEGYYIDRLLEGFEEIIPEEDRDFDQTILYAPETDADTVIDTCNRYPMMSPRQVVILKEAQSAPADFLKKLSKYIENPSSSTLFVVSFRGEPAKGREFLAAMKKGPVVSYESKRLTDRSVGPVIMELLKVKGMGIDPKALEMMKDYVGSDVSLLYNEIGKLAVALPKGSVVTPEAVAANIGINKDYNNFELVGAVSRRDYAKSMKIVRYFRSNPKNNPVFPSVSLLFNLFSNLLASFYAPDKSDRSIMQVLGFKSPYQLTDVKAAMTKYSAWQTIEIISEIRKFDTQAKGIGSRKDQYDLLEELIFKIMTAKGSIELKS